MKVIDIESAKAYRTTFASGEYLKLGPGTMVQVLRLEAELGTECEKMRSLIICATVKFTVRAQVACIDCCHICGAPPPPPYTFWYIVENHDGGRLLFPRLSNGDSPDAYPVPDWKRVDGQMTCAACAEEIEEAKAEIRKRKRVAK